ncbi:type II toxin-antitoxin system RelE/ParE family toxin [Gordonia sp. (in: high G+C Gram-positive bacteria)]|uniref:type II toxin-antitoxin system RelE/ParE family toxin n=1 Tax=Gordonia sp. (in: high G+C Gram-positive bacteria) TaxID=84139 RepID=UPI0026039235|nr:type II toxin-antitoxin system RelE/ParE family toxin [Gordonia sp. (in: high G+C Gram-positive bacteria)]
MGIDRGTWQIELSEEVRSWLDGLTVKGQAQAFRALDLLAAEGVMLRMPHARKLDDKLWELRFRCDQVNQRITYTIHPERNVITLTTFRKQRNNERKEVQRARNVLRRRDQKKEGKS